MSRTTHQPPAPMGRGTLSRRLVLRTAALVALVAVTLGLISTLAVRQIMLRQLDDRLHSAVNTQKMAPNPDSDHDGRSNPLGIDLPGMPPGTLLVTAFGQVVKMGEVRQGSYGSLNLEQANALLSGLTPDQVATVSVPDRGSYRAELTQRTIDGVVVNNVVALPLAELNHALMELVLLEAIITVVAVGAAVVITRTVIVRSLRPLNSLAAAATAVSNLELDRGEVSLAVRVPASNTDHTNEVGQVGHAFNHMLNNVEGALAARQQSETKVRQFVADASHELRNPLAAIRGYSELTRRSRDQLPEDTQFAMARIEAESARMSKLVEDMLLLARLDNDPNLQLAPVDVVEVVLNATSDAQVAWKTHTWRLSLPEDAVVAEADSMRLHQVVVNLLANAHKHTPPGTTVEAGVRTEGPWAVITVTDDGPGIDPTVRDHVFERFARADAARAHNEEGSTGLGLAIVAAVMQAHHGTASVESQPGRTRFTLRLPLAR